MIKTAPEHEAFLDQLADALCKHGLRFPALIALEAGKPIAFIGGQLLWVGQPLLSLFLPKQLIQEAAQVLEKPEALNALISRLETTED